MNKIKYCRKCGNEYVSENEPRYLAYRLAGESGSVEYLPDEEICVYWKEIDDPSYSRYDMDLAKSRHRSIKLTGEYGWAQDFNAIQKKYKENPIEMTKALERLLESYLDVFWYHYDIGELTDLLKSVDKGIIFTSNLYDEWEWPTEPEIQEYKASYRQKMKEYLRPVMKAMAQKALLELNELTLKEVGKLWDVVNMIIDFQIIDENLKAGFDEEYMEALDNPPNNTYYSYVFTWYEFGEYRYDGATNLTLYHEETTTRLDFSIEGNTTADEDVSASFTHCS